MSSQDTNVNWDLAYFNNLVNLPELCRLMGIKHLDFVHIPKHGWFAYDNRTQPVKFSNSKTQIFNCYDLLKGYQNILPVLVRRYPKALSRPITCDRFNSRQLNSSLRAMQNAYRFYERSLRHRYWATRRVRFTSIRNWCGRLKRIDRLKGGLASAKTLRGFSEHKLPIRAGKQYLVLPTFSSPRHLASLRLYDLVTLKYVGVLWTSGAEGWMGSLNSRIGVDVNDVSHYGGNTWETSCSYWMDKPIKLSPKLQARDCLTIWMENCNAVFDRSLMDGISKETMKQFFVENQHRLSLAQILELNKTYKLDILTGTNLIIPPNKQCQINGLIFYETEHGYALDTEYGAQRITNFTLQLKKSIRNSVEWYWLGVINHKGNQYPFMAANGDLYDRVRLREAIGLCFESYKAGIPAIMSQYVDILPDIILFCNQDAPIEYLHDDPLMAKQIDALPASFAPSLQENGVGFSWGDKPVV